MSERGGISATAPPRSESLLDFSVYGFYSTSMMTPAHCATFPAQKHLAAKILAPQGSWHFHNACSKDDHGLANDPVIARRMVLATTALMEKVSLEGGGRMAEE